MYVEIHAFHWFPGLDEFPETFLFCLPEPLQDPNEISLA
jgi:hypothetical protein